METMTKKIRMRDGYSEELETNAYYDVELQVYNVEEVNDLEEGTIFGIIASTYDMDVVSPYTEFSNDGKLEYALSTYQDLISEDFEIESEAFMDGVDVPLIFKKLDGNLAQELLSGRTFILGSNRISSSDTEDFDVLSTDIKQFQRNIEKYKDNNVLIYIDVHEVKDRGQEIDSSFSGLFEVNDNFKSLYSNKTLQKKEEVIMGLGEIQQQSKEHFESNYKKCIDVVHGIADTENILYDMAHSTEDKPKAM